jgi:hypothetical protein
VGPRAADGTHPIEVTQSVDGAWRDNGDGSKTLENDVFSLDVVVKNTTTSPMHLRYRRVMDWDVPPTVFDEYVTIAHASAGAPSWVVATTNNGFDVADPLAAPQPLSGSDPSSASGWFDDVGHVDQGSLFDLDFGTLAPGAEKHFTLFYGAFEDEAHALGALDRLGAAAWSLGEPAADPAGGTPNTFAFGVKDA